MATAEATPKPTGTVKPGEYRTDGKRLLRVVDEMEREGFYMTEDAKTEHWVEMSTDDLLAMKVVRRARKAGRGE